MIAIIHTWDTQYHRRYVTMLFSDDCDIKSNLLIPDCVCSPCYGDVACQRSTRWDKLGSCNILSVNIEGYSVYGITFRFSVQYLCPNLQYICQHGLNTATVWYCHYYYAMYMYLLVLHYAFVTFIYSRAVGQLSVVSFHDFWTCAALKHMIIKFLICVFERNLK